MRWFPLNSTVIFWAVALVFATQDSHAAVERSANGGANVAPRWRKSARWADRRTQELRQSIANRNDLYVTSRDLRDYFYYFGNIQFPHALAALRPNQSLLDVGAGHAHALIEYASKQSMTVYDGWADRGRRLSTGSLEQRPQLIALALQAPRSLNRAQLAKHQIEYIEDSIESYALKHPSSIDVLMDSRGALLYGKRDDILLAFLTVLKPGGQAFVSLGQARIIDAQGNDVSTVGYLAMGRGFEVKRPPTSSWSAQNPNSYELVRTREVADLPALSVIRQSMSEEGPRTLYQIN